MPSSVLRFDQYEVDIRAGELSKHGLRVSLRDKSFQILALLLEHAGEIVTREELQRRLWPADVFVDVDNNLNTAVASLRQALCDSAERPRFIQTVPKRGYRFLPRVSESLPATRHTAPPRARIVVLPFVNLSGEPSQEYFSDAMTDEIITALAGVAPEHLAVIARTTAMYYKGRHKDVAHIRRELGVDYLVEGAIRRTESRVGINIQLIQTSDQTHLFAKKYEAPLYDVFDVQNCIARSIGAHIPELATRTDLHVAGGLATKKPTKDLVAYNFYLQGRYCVQHCAPDPATEGAKAIRYFEDAIARDPEFALAYAALADVYWWVGQLGLLAPAKEILSAGMRAAQRAVEIDPSLAYAHAMLGVLTSHLEYDWPKVEREMKLARQLDPKCPETRFRYASGYLLPQGRTQEAIAELERALESDPVSVYIRYWLGFALYCAHEHSRALEQFQFLMELAPDRHPELTRALDIGHLGMGLLRAAEGHFEEAVAHFRRSVDLSGDLFRRGGVLGLALARSGNTTEARALLARLQALSAQQWVPPMTFAWLHLGLGEIDAAFCYMERAVDESDPHVVGINTFPTLEALRAHPRFAALIRKMNLQP